MVNSKIDYRDPKAVADALKEVQEQFNLAEKQVIDLDKRRVEVTLAVEKASSQMQAAIEHVGRDLTLESLFELVGRMAETNTALLELVDNRADLLDAANNVTMFTVANVAIGLGTLQHHGLPQAFQQVGSEMNELRAVVMRLQHALLGQPQASPDFPQPKL